MLAPPNTCILTNPVQFSSNLKGRQFLCPSWEYPLSFLQIIIPESYFSL